uniref:Beta/alpha-defensin C-terminal domain-containing protein n=1 Tax=Anolis carolinensis TaxID=28377 RepID=A0A803TQ64_ANOCA
MLLQVILMFPLFTWDEALPSYFFLPRNARECHQANGSCKWFGCTFPLVRRGKCGFIKKCCIR